LKNGQCQAPKAKKRVYRPKVQTGCLTLSEHGRRGREIASLNNPTKMDFYQGAYGAH